MDPLSRRGMDGIVGEGWLGKSRGPKKKRSTKLKCSAGTELIGGALRFVDWRMLLENVDEMAAGFRHADMFATNDFAGLHGVTVDVAAGIIVRTNGGAFEGNSREKSLGTRVAEYLSAHPSVGIRGCGASLGTCGNGSIAAQLHLAAEDRIHTSAIHNQQDQVGSFSADLEADASAFKSVHRRGSPSSAEVLAGAANHSSASVLSADSECQFFDARDDDDAFGFVQKILGNVVWYVENFGHNNAAFFEAPLFLVELPCVDHTCYERKTCCGNQKFLHH